jgi:hypothetical protein
VDPDPDPEGPKTYGSGSTTLLKRKELRCCHIVSCAGRSSEQPGQCQGRSVGKNSKKDRTGDQLILQLIHQLILQLIHQLIRKLESAEKILFGEAKACIALASSQFMGCSFCAVTFCSFCLMIQSEKKLSRKSSSQKSFLFNNKNLAYPTLSCERYFIVCPFILIPMGDN